MNKKVFLIALVAIISLSIVARAQENPNSVAELKLKKYTKMKNIGLGMVYSGAVCTVGGIILISNAETKKTEDIYGNTQYTFKDSKGPVGVLLTAVGVSLVGGGIVFAVIGSKKVQKYKKQLNNLTLVPYTNTKQTGFLLSYKF